MAKKKRFERIIVLSDSEDVSSDEDLHQPRPRKKPRLPNQEQEGGFNTGLTPRQPDINTPLPSSSNDIYRSNNVIVISDDDDDDFRSEETPIRKRLRTSDTEATDASKQWESPVVSDSDDDDCVIITPTTAVTDKDPVEYLEDPTSEERRPKCNIHNCFIEDITSSTSPYMTHFQATKQELVTRLYKLYNQTVFNNQVSGREELSPATSDGLQISFKWGCLLLGAIVVSESRPTGGSTDTLMDKSDLFFSIWKKSGVSNTNRGHRSSIMAVTNVFCFAYSTLTIANLTP
ncbi:uncharacterized protein LOC142760566 [Rhinoderma darwinii]|uniref:uncharacterized protein LOC142760566 n=1 Tax=Rhinoderma darwinii TaxID=43563 RepID=UPI003F67CC3E